MPIPGAGNQPAGWSPAAAYYPVPPTPAYVPFPDPQTGQADTGRLIDPKTRQFVYQTNSNGYADAQGMGTVPQLVMIAWGRIDVRSKVKLIGTGYQKQIQDLYTSAVSQFVNAKLMAIVSLDSVRFGTNGVKTTIRWRDLTTNIEHTFTPAS